MSSAKRETISIWQKLFGVLVIVLSLGLGLYYMEQFPALQVQWKPGQGQPTALVAKDKNLRLTFVKDWIFPTGMKLDGQEIGGLSALAYDSEKDQVLALSDDRGRNGPSRFFRIDFKTVGQLDLNFASVVLLKDEKNKNFAARTIDPEGLAILSDQSLVWSSEGEQVFPKYYGPRIVMSTKDGRYIRDLSVAKVFWEDGRKNFGVQNNLGFEGLSVDPSKRWLYVTTETALAQDGTVAGYSQGSQVRIAEYDVLSDFEETAQMVYPVEAIPSDIGAKMGVEIAMNGVSEILALDQRLFLVVERAYLAHRKENRVRLYFADCQKATDVRNLESLLDQKFQACEKRLVLEFESIVSQLRSGLNRITNLEGMTLIKPKNLDKTYILFVSDNNFKPKQITSFLLFEVEGWNH